MADDMILYWFFNFLPQSLKRHFLRSVFYQSDILKLYTLRNFSFSLLGTRQNKEMFIKIMRGRTSEKQINEELFSSGVKSYFISPEVTDIFYLLTMSKKQIFLSHSSTQNTFGIFFFYLSQMRYQSFILLNL